MSTMLNDISQHEGSASFWAKMIQQVGVPIIMLGIVLFAFWRGAEFIGNEILLPTLEDNKRLVAGQVEANKALLTSLNEITTNIRIQTEANEQNAHALASMAANISAIKDATETTVRELKQKSLDEAKDKN